MEVIPFSGSLLHTVHSSSIIKRQNLTFNSFEITADNFRWWKSSNKKVKRIYQDKK